MSDGSLRIYPVASCVYKCLSKSSVQKIIVSYPEKQHLKTPPLFRHFLANLLYSPFRQFFQPLVGSQTFPEPGTKETKSNPYVSFKIFAPMDAVGIGNLKMIIQKTYQFLPIFLSFVISFQAWGSSKLKKCCNTFIIQSFNSIR